MPRQPRYHFSRRTSQKARVVLTLVGFAAGDATGDGNLDIVAVGSCGPMLTYAGDGQGHFNTVNAPETDNVPYALSMGTYQLQALAGKLNLVYGTDTENIQTGQTTIALVGMPSNGDGTFGSANTLASISGSFQFQDINADGIPDIVTSDGDGNLYVAPGRSDGSFQPPVSVIGGATAVYPSSFALVDVNGDNLPDFIDVEKGFIGIYLNDGDETFGGPSGIATANYSSSFDYTGLGGVAVGDFNADGKIDLAVTDYFYGRTSIYFGNGGGSFQGASQIAEGAPEPTVPDYLATTTALDVNGDGKQDILVANEGGSVLQILSGISDGKGGFTYKTALSGSSIFNLENILQQTGDFNGDGLQDIILYSETGTGAPVVSVSLSNGDGTFQHPAPIQLPNTPAGFPR